MFSSVFVAKRCREDRRNDKLPGIRYSNLYILPSVMVRCVSLILITLFIATGCDHAFREWKKDPFTTLSWKTGEEIVYHPEIADIAKTYEIVLGVRHTYGARIRNLPLLVKIVSPSGREYINKYSLEITTPEGKPMASCAGNLCDLERTVGEIVFEEEGKYQFRISHTDANSIRGILELGLILKAKH